jgi:hypothetical protein
VLAVFAFAASSAQAQWWHRHPGYLHAMSDLRTAYWLIQHHNPDDPEMYRDERGAMNAVRAAYQELKNASIIDDKDIDDQPPAQMAFDDHRGRLTKAITLIREARSDINVEEDDREARGLRNRALLHINDAINHLKDAMDYWQFCLLVQTQPVWAGARRRPAMTG